MIFVYLWQLCIIIWLMIFHMIWQIFLNHIVLHSLFQISIARVCWWHLLLSVRHDVRGSRHPRTLQQNSASLFSAADNQLRLFGASAIPLGAVSSPSPSQVQYIHWSTWEQRNQIQTVRVEWTRTTVGASAASFTIDPMGRKRRRSGDEQFYAHQFGHRGTGSYAWAAADVHAVWISSAVYGVGVCDSVPAGHILLWTLREIETKDEIWCTIICDANLWVIFCIANNRK